MTCFVFWFRPHSLLHLYTCTRTHAHVQTQLLCFSGGITISTLLTNTYPEDAQDYDSDKTEFFRRRLSAVIRQEDSPSQEGQNFLFEILPEGGFDYKHHHYHHDQALSAPSASAASAGASASADKKELAREDSFDGPAAMKSVVQAAVDLQHTRDVITKYVV